MIIVLMGSCGRDSDWDYLEKTSMFSSNRNGSLFMKFE